MADSGYLRFSDVSAGVRKVRGGGAGAAQEIILAKCPTTVLVSGSHTNEI